MRIFIYFPFRKKLIFDELTLNLGISAAWKILIISAQILFFITNNKFYVTFRFFLFFLKTRLFSFLRCPNRWPRPDTPIHVPDPTRIFLSCRVGSRKSETGRVQNGSEKRIQNGSGPKRILAKHGKINNKQPKRNN